MIKSIQNFRQRMYDYSLNKLQKTSGEIPRSSQRFEDVKTIGILFDATQVADHILINNFCEKLKKKKKKVEVLGFFNDKDEHNNVIFKYFTKKHTNWYMVPKGEVVETFIEKKYDVLISMHLNSVPQLEFISAASKAKIRVGLYREQTQDFYDLMISPPSKLDLQIFGKEIESLLTKIHRNAN